MQENLISFKSGHYKKLVGEWVGDSVWGHFRKEDGTMVHINKDEVEYIEVWQLDDPEPPKGGKK